MLSLKPDILRFYCERNAPQNELNPGPSTADCHQHQAAQSDQAGVGTKPCLASICSHLGALRATIKAS